MSPDAFVVCALSNSTDSPVVLSEFQGSRDVSQDYLYWSNNPDTWRAYHERENALEEGISVVHESLTRCIDVHSLWVMPLAVAQALLGPALG